MESAQNSTLKSENTNLPQPEKELFAWTAAARPFKRRDREFWVSVIAIAAVVSLVLFLVEGFMPVVLIISLVFLFYVLNTVEPEKINYQITTRGVKFAGRQTPWEVIGRHWFTRRYDSQILVLELGVLPGRLEMVIDPGDKEKISTALSDYSLAEEIPPSNLDRAANWFAKKLPGNNV
jgi:hypothetical protein